jgi:redox-sensitive bicupin YhaK (pirin superfamily)
LSQEAVHFDQIWILPEKKGLEPSYEQKSFPAPEKQGRLRLLASRDGKEGSVRINQDVQLYVTLLQPGEEVVTELAGGRHGWLQVAKGAVELNGQKLGPGDGAAISNEKGSPSGRVSRARCCCLTWSKEPGFQGFGVLGRAIKGDRTS